MSVLSALRRFADAVAAKAALPASGAPEDRLRAPFEALMAEAGAALGHDVACAGEARLPDRLGRPDFAIHRNGLLAGYAELKAPGKGAASQRVLAAYVATLPAGYDALKPVVVPAPGGVGAPDTPGWLDDAPQACEGCGMHDRALRRDNAYYLCPQVGHARPNC